LAGIPPQGRLRWEAYSASQTPIDLKGRFAATRKGWPRSKRKGGKEGKERIKEGNGKRKRTGENIREESFGYGLG